jgi:hypothetical protein
MPLGMIRGEGQGGGWAAGRAGRGELGDGQGRGGLVMVVWVSVVVVL